MDFKSRAEHLAGIDLFRAFSEEELLSFAEDTNEVTFKAGEQIFGENDQGSDIYVVLEGSVKISKGSRFITEIQPIDYLGEMAILENKPRSATATAITPAHLLQITGSQFQRFLTKHPSSLVPIMKTLSGRVRKDTELISAEFEKANILIHDMRNRLSAFLLLNLIDKKPLSDKEQKYINIMKHSYADLSTLMEEALANAKRLKYTHANGNSSIAVIVDELHQTEISLHEALKDKKVVIDVPSDLPELRVPPGDIRRVLTNLVINAGQASDPGSEIHISARRKDVEIEVSVADFGHGIPVNLQSKIFQPHFTTKGDGNGFGLASCKDIIENKHNGRISFHSTEKGTTFTFRLPANDNSTPNFI